MKLSQEKRDKISEQILQYLFNIFPEKPFTAKIAKETARDEEFTKKLLNELKEKTLVISIKKNKNKIFSRRIRWTLSKKVYDVFHKNQTT